MRWNVNSGSYTIGDLDKLFTAKKLVINKDYQRGFYGQIDFKEI